MISKNQADILEHTIKRAAYGLYCGGGDEMDKLVNMGFMVPAGRKSFVPDEYFGITREGKAALTDYEAYMRTDNTPK